MGSLHYYANKNEYLHFALQLFRDSYCTLQSQLKSRFYFNFLNTSWLVLSSYEKIPPIYSRKFQMVFLPKVFCPKVQISPILSATYGTINTGHGERLITRLATLSDVCSRSKPIPRLPITIKLTLSSSATSQIVKAGFPSRCKISA